jgi:hypothetical protein
MVCGKVRPQKWPKFRHASSVQTEPNPCVNQLGELHLSVGPEVSLKAATTASNRQFSGENMGMRRATCCDFPSAVNP